MTAQSGNLNGLLASVGTVILFEVMQSLAPPQRLTSPLPIVPSSC
jgi:hypothetical protein